MNALFVGRYQETEASTQNVDLIFCLASPILLNLICDVSRLDHQIMSNCLIVCAQINKILKQDKSAYPCCHPHTQLVWTMVGTHPLKSSGDLPCALGKPGERSLKVLDPEDPSDWAFRPVRCIGLFLFMFVYPRSSVTSPV